MTPREELRKEELRKVVAEIRAYPRPIAGCDAQFNHLLERRAELEAALRDARAAQDA